MGILFHEDLDVRSGQRPRPVQTRLTLAPLILFLKSKSEPQKSEVLQKEVWGYLSELETHTVETHVYRLRKKIKDIFNDENFLISQKNGYTVY